MKPVSPPPAPADKVDAALVAAVRNLEAAVQEQERAVNRILGLVELVMERRPDQSTLLRLEGIMEACAFQDLTGQRIRKVTRFLRHLAAHKGLMPKGMDGATAAEDEQALSRGKGLSQEEVDRLLGKR